MARQSLSVNSVGVTTWCAWNLLSAAELEPEPEPGPGAGAGAGAELELEEPLEGRFENSTMAGMSASRVSGVKHPRSGAGCRCSETADAEEHQSRDARTQTMWRGTASKVGRGRGCGCGRGGDEDRAAANADVDSHSQSMSTLRTRAPSLASNAASGRPTTSDLFDGSAPRCHAATLVRSR
jgi:hypothetical protein